MLTLSLLRHGKSSWAETNLDDHERPLAERGRSAAETMGAFMADRGLRPDFVLCSTAERARATLRLVLTRLGPPAPEVVHDPGLYLAAATTLLSRLRQARSGVRHQLLVGHNPGLHALALELTGIGLRRDIATMAMKFPTCGLAVITFESEDWGQLRPAAGRLELFMPPRRLP